MTPNEYLGVEKPTLASFIEMIDGFGIYGLVYPGYLSLLAENNREIVLMDSQRVKKKIPAAQREQWIDVVMCEYLGTADGKLIFPVRDVWLREIQVFPPDDYGIDVCCRALRDYAANMKPNAKRDDR